MQKHCTVLTVRFMVSDPSMNKKGLDVDKLSAVLTTRPLADCWFTRPPHRTLNALRAPVPEAQKGAVRPFPEAAVSYRYGRDKPTRCKD